MSSEQILGFNPKQEEYKCFMVTIDATKAKYILDYHNDNNRNFYATQLRDLRKSITEDGWCEDGGSMTFNTDGDLTEFQHRLDTIVQEDLIVLVPTVVGVKPDTFTKTAPAKRRTAIDEMYRKDKTCVKDDETVLRSFLNRKGKVKLTLKNAVVMWNKHKTDCRQGITISQSILKNPTYESWGKEILGFSALMCYVGEKNTAINLLKLLEDHIHGRETTLTKGVRKYIDVDAGSPLDMTNVDKANSRFFLLCAAADKLLEKSDGMIELGFSKNKCNHESKKRKGIYRRFLDNPNNIGDEVKYAGKTFI